MSNLLKRTIFGAIYVALIILSLCIEEPTLFLSLFSVFIFVAIWEYQTIFQLNRTRPLRKILDGLATVYLFIALFLVLKGDVDPSNNIGKLFAPYFSYLLFILVRAIYSDRDMMPKHLAKVIFGQFYVGGLFATAIPLFIKNPLILLLIFICIWLNDTGAYLFGSKFGKRRLFPSVSPKKSWEGFFGGLFVVYLGLILITSFYPKEFDLQWFDIILFGGIVSVFSTWGDLFESMLKRSAGVKDSGRIIPGHGGVLDRLDSFMFATPAIFILSLFHV